MKNLFYLIIPLCIPLFSFGQNYCGETGLVEELHNGNEIRTFSSNNGVQFINQSDAGFKLNYETASTIFADHLRFSALDPSQNLKISISDYGVSFPSGIIANTDPDVCDFFQKVWSVSASEINNHIDDYADNGVIDNDPPEDILYWPGKGNPAISVVLPFRDFAPYHDVNNDGIYNPIDGDYPSLDGSASLIPEQMSWSLYHTSVDGAPFLPLEVSQMLYSFACTDNPIINRTVFSRYEITNMGLENLNSILLSKYVDFDIGCPTDDYLGSAPALNTVYAYNSVPMDGGVFCQDLEFQNQAPAQALVFLDEDLSSFNFESIFDASPSTAVQYLNVMSGLNIDGTPMLDDSGQATNYLYSDNPNDASGWSMHTSLSNGGDLRANANMSLGNLAPDEKRTITMAYSYHHKDGLSYLENVDLMYNQLPAVQSFFDNDYQNCTAVTSCTSNDCVWPGDTDKDGIVSHLDILPIGYALSATGPARELSNSSWSPKNANDWTNNFYNNSVNEKHIDCTGNGTVDVNDFNIVRYDNYKKENASFGGIIGHENAGDELYVELVQNDTEIFEYEPNEAKWIYLKIDPNLIPSNIKGLGFVFEFDSTLFELSPTILPQFASSPINYFYLLNRLPNRIEFSTADPNLMLNDNILRIILEAGSNLNFNNQEKIITQFTFKEIGAIDEFGNEIMIGGTTKEVHILNPNYVGIKNETASHLISISPNPAKDHLFVSIEKGNIEQVQIYSTEGKLLQSENRIDSQVKINVSNLNAGIYFLQIKSGDQLITKRFSVLK